MIRKTTLIVTILLVFQLNSRAQRVHKHVPFFNTFNTAKLAVALSNGLESDSIKVRAIHSWIVRNIRYDVRKYLNFDYNHIPVKKILTKRKAICTGYADLFNELCSKAGITATYISGYTRNENTDLFDPFYVEDHIWNAVYINDQWKLVDPTWDAGYIDYYRKTFAGWIVWGATLGRNTILRYKPHFVRMPHNGFLMRSGTFFISDHVPMDPFWQKLNPPRTIEVCENVLKISYMEPGQTISENTINRW